ncbi:MAG: hypothetical protein JWO07_213 [Candidatus Saccharibacteria bacterium]|nr:hypothetical protein [Candidatus Saccharibacteria bacterium]
MGNEQNARKERFENGLWAGLCTWLAACVTCIALGTSYAVVSSTATHGETVERWLTAAALCGFSAFLVYLSVHYIRKATIIEEIPPTDNRSEYDSELALEACQPH